MVPCIRVLNLLLFLLLNFKVDLIQAEQQIFEAKVKSEGVVENSEQFLARFTVDFSTGNSLNAQRILELAEVSISIFRTRLI